MAKPTPTATELEGSGPIYIPKPTELQRPLVSLAWEVTATRLAARIRRDSKR
jgi:hypothetical protein